MHEWALFHLTDISLKFVTDGATDKLSAEKADNVSLMPWNNFDQSNLISVASSP